MHTAGNSLALLNALYGGKTETCRTAMEICLDTLLAEALDDLDRCAGERTVPLRLRSGLCRVIDRVGRLRTRLPGLGHAASHGDPRARLAEVERLSLFDAFRDRCAGLAGRLSDPDGREAAVTELDVAVTVLARSIGLPDGGSGVQVR